VPLFLTTQNSTASAQQVSEHLQLVPGITGNVLTVVSFLIGTSSFIVGLRIQNATNNVTTPSSSITGYFELLILALVIPAIIFNIYGIFLVEGHLDPSNSPYLILIYAHFIPAGAILFLVVKSHSLTVKRHQNVPKKYAYGIILGR
jgi:hypothetical protein